MPNIINFMWGFKSFDSFNFFFITIKKNNDISDNLNKYLPDYVLNITIFEHSEDEILHSHSLILINKNYNSKQIIYNIQQQIPSKLDIQVKEVKNKPSLIRVLNYMFKQINGIYDIKLISDRSSINIINSELKTFLNVVLLDYTKFDLIKSPLKLNAFNSAINKEQNYLQEHICEKIILEKFINDLKKKHY